jgi:hypothetical protein
MRHLPEALSDLTYDSILSFSRHGCQPEDGWKHLPQQLFHDMITEEWRIRSYHAGWELIPTRILAMHGIKIQPPVVNLQHLMLEIKEGISGVIMSMNKRNSNMFRAVV